MIKNRTALIAAAALAVGTLGLSGFTLAQEKGQTNGGQDQSSSTTPRQQDASAESQAADTKGVRDLLSSATESATRSGGFSDLAKYFARSSARHTGDRPQDSGNETLNGLKDRANAKTPDELKKLEDGSSQLQADLKDKAGQETRVDTSKLDQRIAQFRKDWKEKYSQDFRAGDEAVVYADITARDVSAGEAMPASAKIRSDVEANARFEAAKGNAAAHEIKPNTETNAPDAGAAHPSSQYGQRVVLNVPAYQGAEALSIQLVREDSSKYRFARPMSFDRQKLADNLAKHIGMVDDNKANWPADMNVASRLVTQHVLMAVSETAGNMQHPAQGALPAAAESKANAGN